MNYSIIERYNCGVEVESNEEIVQSILKYYNGSDTEVEETCKNAIEAAKDFDFKRHTKKLISIFEDICNNCY